MKNNLQALNNYLFAEMELLTDEEELNKDDNFDKVIKHSKAVTNVAQTIINNAELILNAQKFVSDEGRGTKLPSVLLGNAKNEKMYK